MKRLNGLCESCESYSPFLERKSGLWLCTVCRDRKSRLEKII